MRKNISLDINLVVIGKHKPIVKVLMIGIKFMEERLKQFWVWKKDTEDVSLAFYKFFRSFARYQWPDAEIKCRRQRLTNHHI